MSAAAEWRQRLRRAGAKVAVAATAVDAAFAHLDATMRAAKRAGRTGAHLVTVTGLSTARVDEAIAAGGAPSEDAGLPHSDTDLRIAAYAAAAAVAGHLAARGRRDVLMLQAGQRSALAYTDIAEAAGTSRRYEWELRTGRLAVDRRSTKQDVFEGSGVTRYRATENARLRDRRRAIQAGAEVSIKHGLHGYRHGCRCSVCMAARHGVQEGTVQVNHGLDGYRHGCRCAVCREAHADYHREWRSRKKARGER